MTDYIPPIETFVPEYMKELCDMYAKPLEFSHSSKEYVNLKEILNEFILLLMAMAEQEDL